MVLIHQPQVLGVYHAVEDARYAHQEVCVWCVNCASATAWWNTLFGGYLVECTCTIPG